MRPRLISLAVVLIGFGTITAASAAPPALPPLKITEVSTDATYGTEPNPIRTGGAFTDGVERERAYLLLLRGPHRERVSFEREGSCCSFPTPNGLIGGSGLLDIYVVKIEDGATVKLYLDMYDYDAPKAPVGFTFAE
jgi:hypothetical protein